MGWLILVYLGLEGLGVLCLLFCFFFCLGFVSVLFALFLFCCWIVFGVVLVLFLFFLILFFFVFFVFVFFFGGFKGQVRWPKGPPHLALNPPSFFVLV